MLLKVFTVYDCKVEAYLTPFFMKTKGEAIRGYSEVVNDVKTQFNRYPEDYTLFELGTYDDSTAKFVLHSTPVSIGKALEFLKPTSLHTGGDILPIANGGN